MNDFEHFFKPIVDVGLMGFGFANRPVRKTILITNTNGCRG